jgi:hypothetical protein
MPTGQDNNLTDFFPPIPQRLPEEAAQAEMLVKIARTYELGGCVILAINHGEAEAQAELANKLYALLDRRERRLRSGDTHVVRRRLAISDEEVNYLIGRCLDSAAENGLPLSDELRTLVKRQLGGTALPQSKVERIRHLQFVEDAAAGILRKGKTPTFREIARVLGVEPSTVTRWFSPEERKRLLNFWDKAAVALRRPSRLGRQQP